MKKKTTKKATKTTCEPKKDCKGPSGCMPYILAAIGAAVYYIANSTGFWNGVLGILKALVWPAFLMIELLKFLGA